jgi:hypothetical protein
MRRSCIPRCDMLQLDLAMHLGMYKLYHDEEGGGQVVYTIPLSILTNAILMKNILGI